MQGLAGDSNSAAQQQKAQNCEVATEPNSTPGPQLTDTNSDGQMWTRTKYVLYLGLKKLVLGYLTVLFSLNSDWMDAWVDGELNQMACQAPFFSQSSKSSIYVSQLTSKTTKLEAERPGKDWLPDSRG